MEPLKTSFASLNSPQQCLLFSFCGENMCENRSGNQSFMIITDTSPRSATTPPLPGVGSALSDHLVSVFSQNLWKVQFRILTGGSKQRAKNRWTVFCSQFCCSPPQAAPGDSDKSQIPKCNSHTCISHSLACKIVRQQFASFAVYIRSIFFLVCLNHLWIVLTLVLCLACQCTLLPQLLKMFHINKVWLDCTT